MQTYMLCSKPAEKHTLMMYYPFVNRIKQHYFNVNIKFIYLFYTYLQIINIQIQIIFHGY